MALTTPPTASRLSTGTGEYMELQTQPHEPARAPDIGDISDIGDIGDIGVLDTQIELYPQQRAASARPTDYRVEPVHEFSEQERAELEELLAVKHNPYTDYGAYWDEIRDIARRRIPPFFREIMEQARSFDLTQRPVLYFKNCPTGHVPELSFEDPLRSKYERKSDYIAEAFHSVFAELHGTAQVTYRSANQGDMFHDVTPMKKLAYTITQRTLNTLHFHFDLPDHKIRPDWVYLLSLRNSPRNIVFTPIVRLRDALEQLDDHTLAVLRRPLFAQPRPKVAENIPHYGVKESGYHDPRPILVERGGTRSLMFFEGCHASDDAEGAQALEQLRAVLHRSKYDLFLAERDFIAMSNSNSMHARHVVAINDLEAHHRRWILKTWVVNDLEAHRHHFMNDRINTSDE
jgi:L-asparagine oxygenase